MEQTDQRAALERLIQERREDYAGLSRLLRRNPAYIQQFIKRGIPRKLAEEDRRTLAQYFRVDEQVLGGPPAPASSARPGDLIPVPRLDIGVSAGPGAWADEELVIAHIAFEKRWLRRLCGAHPDDLSIVVVRGDSMSPSLIEGDEIMVDRSDAGNRLRDGIYILRREEELIVKRLAVNPATRRITIKSDNSAYPIWPECKVEDITIIGRVVWAARKVS